MQKDSWRDLRVGWRLRVTVQLAENHAARVSCLRNLLTFLCWPTVIIQFLWILTARDRFARHIAANPVCVKSVVLVTAFISPISPVQDLLKSPALENDGLRRQAPRMSSTKHDGGDYHPVKLGDTVAVFNALNTASAKPQFARSLSGHRRTTGSNARSSASTRLTTTSTAAKGPEPVKVVRCDGLTAADVHVLSTPCLRHCRPRFTAPA